MAAKTIKVRTIPDMHACPFLNRRQAFGSNVYYCRAKQGGYCCMDSCPLRKGPITVQAE